MPRQRGSRFLRGTVGSQRKTSWTGGAASSGPGATQSISVSGALLLGVGLQAIVSGLTIVRTRGNLSLFLVTADAEGSGFNGAFGLGVVSENAFGVGVTAVPHPIADDDWDGWFYHRKFALFAPAAITAAGSAKEWSGIGGVAGAIQIDVDSKAMRKFKESDVVVAVLETTEVGTSIMRVAFDSRTLVKLP